MYIHVIENLLHNSNIWPFFYMVPFSQHAKYMDIFMQGARMPYIIFIIAVVPRNELSATKYTFYKNMKYLLQSTKCWLRFLFEGISFHPGIICFYVLPLFCECEVGISSS